MNEFLLSPNETDTMMSPILLRSKLRLTVMKQLALVIKLESPWAVTQTKAVFNLRLGFLTAAKRPRILNQAAGLCLVVLQLSNFPVHKTI